MAEAGTEKRRRKRYAVSNVQLEYAEGNLFSLFRRGRPPRHPIVDLSADGLQFLCDQRLKEGKTLKMLVLLPAGRGTVALNGQVRWTQQIPGKPLYRTGVQFVGGAQADRDNLEQFEDELGEQSIRILCNACGASFRAKRRLEGRKAKCPKCSQVIEIINADPEGGTASADEHVSAPAAEPASAGALSEALRQFLQRHVKTRLHLAVLEEAAKTNVFTSHELARIVHQPESRIRAICHELQSHGILREVGVHTYNLSTGAGARQCMREIRRAGVGTQKRAAIVAFVIQQEMKQR